MTEREPEALAAVHAAEDDLRPVLRRQLREAVGADPAVEERLRAWTGDVPAGDLDTAVRRAAAREAVVATNHVRYHVAVGATPPASLRSTPVAPFAGLDRPDPAAPVLARLRRRLAARDDATDELLGAGYEAALSADERRTRGQFYTPRAVAELVVRWALDGRGERPRVLDPAAGTGTFHRAAAQVRSGGPGGVPASDLLSGFVAVDVDEVALHVAALRLVALKGGEDPSHVDRRPCSFFDLEPGTDVEPVDAVVGNPPFVRASDLSPNREHFRGHLAALGPAGASPYLDGERKLSRRCDAAVYFVTHATRFLRPGGRLGMVLPAKWLESDYGTSFRGFLDDHYDVDAVVGFDARAFDALVDTVLLLAERRDGGRPHDGDSDVQFLRLDGRPDVAAALDRLRDDGAIGGAGGRSRPGVSGTVRARRRPQSTFAEARQCSPYLRAPDVLLPLLDHPGFVELGDLAAVSRGVTTGANRFFLLDDDDRERWDVGDECCRPALRSIRGFSSRTLRTGVVSRSVLDVHDILAERLDAEDEGDPTAAAKAALCEAGHGGIVDYVEHAEARDWHAGRTCRARRVWFDLGDLPTPDAFVPKLVRERVFTVRNRAGAVASNAIDCLDVRDGVDPDLLLGVLDSSLCRALMEVWGRDEAGLLQLMTYETRTLPVPDVRDFPAAAASAVREAAADLDPDGDDRAARRELDGAVVEAAGLDLDAGDLRRTRELLVRRRVDRGDRVEAPVA